MAKSEVVFRTRTGREESLSGRRLLIKQLVRSTIRKLWSRYSPEREEVLFKARVETPKILKSGKQGKSNTVEYRCAACKTLNPIDEVQVDHINPIGSTPDVPLGNWSDWMQAVWCSKSNLQVLCLPCHKLKTAQEKKAGSDKKNATKRGTKSHEKVRSVRRKRKTAKKASKRGPRVAGK